MIYADLVKKIQSAMNAMGSKLTVDGDPGPVTQRECEKYEFAVSAKRIVVLPPPTPDLPAGPEPTYIKLALSHLGVKEVSGSKDNPTIVEYFTATSYWSRIKAKVGKRDEVAWCAAFRDWILRKAGFKDANSAAAKAGTKIGRDITKNPKPYAVAVWKHLKGSLKGRFHTNFLLEPVLNSRGDVVGWWCVGGNQSNAVTRAKYMYEDHQLYYAGMPEPR